MNNETSVNRWDKECGSQSVRLEQKYLRMWCELNGQKDLVYRMVNGPYLVGFTIWMARPRNWSTSSIDIGGCERKVEINGGDYLECSNQVTRLLHYSFTNQVSAIPKYVYKSNYPNIINWNHFDQSCHSMNLINESHSFVCLIHLV